MKIIVLDSANVRIEFFDVADNMLNDDIERWVTEINPKAILRAADARCGAKYAVYVVEKPGDFGTRCTDYLPLEQLEQYLLGVFYANEFNRLIGKKSA